MSTTRRDHGGGIDAAIATYGGTRSDWLDLSTGINPVAYPLPDIAPSDWTALPDSSAMADLLSAARIFWSVPDEADILAAPGASALIARIPALRPAGKVQITTKTYNEHAAAFRAAGWHITDQDAPAKVIVHPNNPDGRLWSGAANGPSDKSLLVIDESFCDVTPAHSHIDKSLTPGVILLKSFGKFWGLAGARLGFAIGLPETLAPLKDMLGPWAVAGPTLRIGTAALNDQTWANETRSRLTQDAARLDQMIAATGAKPIGGT